MGSTAVTFFIDEMFCLGFFTDAFYLVFNSEGRDTPPETEAPKVHFHPSHMFAGVEEMKQTNKKIKNQNKIR